MISRKDVFKDCPYPNTVEKMDEPPMFGLLYKGIHMGLRLLLNIRYNQTQIAKKLGIDLNDNELKKEKKND